MQVSVSQYEEIPLLEVQGEVDRLSGPQLAQAVDQALGDNGKRFILDLTDCPYMDSGGISVLLALVRRVRSAGWVAVVGGSEDITRIFKIVGLTTIDGFHVLRDKDQVKDLRG
jgi:anti-sigma B factor antagonist